MRILIACEFSGIVRDAFIAKGHDAISCDLLPTERLGPHHQGDVLDILGDGFDMMIAHPPCTHLSCSGAKHFKEKIADGRQMEAIELFMKFADAPINRICIENPVGIMSTEWRKPDQIIQPYYFGDEFQKTTCLWLKNLPGLIHLDQPGLFQDKTHVGRGEMFTCSSGKVLPLWYVQAQSGHNRSITFLGIANAMAEQWGMTESIPPC